MNRQYDTDPSDSSGCSCGSGDPSIQTEQKKIPDRLDRNITFSSTAPNKDICGQAIYVSQQQYLLDLSKL